jgi:hypothetical protein
VKKYLTIFIRKRTQEGRNGKGKKHNWELQAQGDLFLSFNFFLMFSECGSSIKSRSQKIRVSINISDYLGQNLSIFSIRDIEIL